ncbi:hypothetical protein [Desmospora profundinema]|uniref:Uncharacterized protein n=1 Tax=Desmospora profundinema TaxID=1571184 RepID=A0ABU1IQR2_9BACL|nr:hypothetical protein [Desmospora profundinema]MDR6227063.1 hypothetical protein [Desmospora profundinema]
MRRSTTKKLAIMMLAFYIVSLLSPFVGIAVANTDYQAPGYQAPEQYKAPEKYQAPEQYKAPEKYQAPEQYKEPEQYNEPESNNPQGSDPSTQQPGSGENNNSGPGLYNSLKYVVNDVILGQVKLIDSASALFENPTNSNINSFARNNIGYNYFGNILRGGLGLAVPSDSGWKTALDTWSGVDTTMGVISTVKDARIFQQAQRLEAAGDVRALAQMADNVPKPMTGLGKFAAWAGVAIGTGEGIYHTYKAFTAETGQERTDAVFGALGGYGGALMAGATLVAAACPPLAIGMAVAGGVMWAASTIYANREQIGRGLKWTGDKISQGAKAVGNGVKSAGKKLGNGLKKVGGWFSK